MRKSDNCSNVKPKAAVIEGYVEESFLEYSNTISEHSDVKDNKKELETSIKKANAKIKKYYRLYADNESDNLLDLIHEEESRVEILKKQLADEKAKDDKSKNEKVKEIKDFASIWDTMTNRQKNKVLKACIDKIVITGDDIDIYYVTY
jgi:site-specific DNA recombinase